jgi:uncharacterized protein YecT (DUF1311 family)
MRAAQRLLVLFFFCVPAHAQDAPDCANALDQMTMNQCAYLDFEKADQALNTLWPRLRDEARQQDTEEGEDKTEYFDALLASQRAWLAYRDTECLRQSQEAKGGSMQPMLESGCRATMTEQRIKDLQAVPEQQ